MKLGIMSDTHGRVPATNEALKELRDAGAEALVHCGDVGSLEVLEALAGWRCWYVWGNTDYADGMWQSHVKAMGLPWPEGPLDLELAGKRIAVYHGHESTFTTALDKARHDYLFHGHTHRRNDYRIGAMRVINPGALHRASVRTVALLDLESDALQFLEVNGHGSLFGLP